MPKLAIVCACASVATAAACGRAPDAGPPASPSPWIDVAHERLEFSGTADAFGHPMLPAGTRGDCELHHVPYEDDVIAAFAGLPYISAPGFEEAEESKFPHAGTVFESGCTLGGPSEVAVSFCSKCREARDAWETNSAAAGHKHPYSEADRQARVAAGAR